MIISYKYRYIFLHCRKTAGSSIAVSLARDLGPDDLQLSGLSETQAEGIRLTKRTHRDAAAQLRDVPRLRNSLALRGLRGRKLKDHVTKKLVLERYRTAWNEPQPQHAYAKTLASALPEEWASFAKFCVVRNPWTKTVSDYFWRTKNLSTPLSFAEFVRAIERGDPMGDIVRPRYHDNWPLYTIDNQIVADHVIRFETLVPGLTDTCARLGIPFDGWLPRAKGSHRPKTGAKADPFRFYTPELRDTVGRLYEREISTFGYTFDRVLTSA
ncbi:sulfotransferase family 2 domain-containing protein [Maliponia aquimaris]|uniref:Sulfotransferase family protein n=1 Tax=Maliponia aquimaris TaxID=1673631 RepID=A0A238KZW4_9RHOB|nr:sulfotransferase family 2 domain-containing protein [Maliponia aquimaris]SMX48319.1 hypothetical protein MAA8898_03898 [Maliponia aquimaris]